MRTNTWATLYNKYIDGHVERYLRTVIGWVEWENQKAANTLRMGGQIEANAATVFIPMGLGADFLAPKAWQKLTSKTGKWTLQPGDLIVKGAVTAEIHDAVTGPPAVAAYSVSNLKADYDDVLTIASVDEMDMGSAVMQHWRVSGK